jgi:hypothetical protein
VGAIGTFTVNFKPSPESLMQDGNGQLISPITISPALITVACANDADCDDGSACTDDSCDAGICVNTDNYDPAVDCCDPVDGTLTLIDDGNDCTTDVCDPATGDVTHDPVPNGTPCDDGMFCVVDEFCTDGVCSGGDSYDCSALDGPCRQGVCDEDLNACVAQAINEGQPCDDGLFCTDDETCAAGECTGGVPHDCTALDDQCNVGVCNEDTDQCEAQPANEGQPCDDGLCCNVNEICTAGTCGGGSPRDCGDGIDCTADTCDEGLAPDCCVNTLVPAYCLIDNVCYADAEFNPANDCEACNVALATETWSYRPSGAECDDGDPCTGTGRPGIGVDTCDGLGVCSGVLDPECNDECEYAVEVHEGVNFGNNDNRGPDDAEASCQVDSNNDVWFKFTPVCTGEIFMSTTGSSFTPENDPVLSVWDECPGLGGIEIACDDDSGVDLQAALGFSATSGSTYWIRVAGFEENSGDIVLNISMVNDCLIDGGCYPDGALNPANECEACIPEISTTSWSPTAEGSPCGDPEDTVCDSPDACDGAGVCESNPKPDGTECPDDGIECTLDICGAGVCTHPPRPEGTPCGDGTITECDKADTCDGLGACDPRYEPVTTPCGDPSDDQCDNPDHCDGAGDCDPNYEIDETPCDDGDICTGDDVCLTGVCIGTPIPVAPIVESQGCRNVYVTPEPAGAPSPVALLLTSPDWTCLSLYIGADGSLGTTPVFQVPDDWGTLIITGPEIVPSSTYEIVAECGTYTSPAGSDTTWPWGDVAGPWDGEGWAPGDGIVDVTDFTAIVEAFRHLETAPPQAWTDIYPCTPDGIIDVLDMTYVVDAFKGLPYPCDGPCP